MSAELIIMSMEFDHKIREHGHKITFTQVGNAIYDTELTEKFEEVSRQNYWSLEGECGFVGELMGRDIVALLKDYEGKQPKNIKLILDNVKAEDYYRIEVSF